MKQKIRMIVNNTVRDIDSFVKKFIDEKVININTSNGIGLTYDIWSLMDELNASTSRSLILACTDDIVILCNPDDKGIFKVDEILMNIHDCSVLDFEINIVPKTIPAKVSIWSDAETGTLKELGPYFSRSEIATILISRSEDAIRRKMTNLGIKYILDDPELLESSQESVIALKNKYRETTIKMTSSYRFDVYEDLINDPHTKDFIADIFDKDDVPAINSEYFLFKNYPKFSEEDKNAIKAILTDDKKCIRPTIMRAILACNKEALTNLALNKELRDRLFHIVDEYIMSSITIDEYHNINKIGWLWQHLYMHNGYEKTVDMFKFLSDYAPKTSSFEDSIVSTILRKKKLDLRLIFNSMVIMCSLHIPHCDNMLYLFSGPYKSDDINRESSEYTIKEFFNNYISEDSSDQFIYAKSSSAPALIEVLLDNYDMLIENDRYIISKLIEVWIAYRNYDMIRMLINNMVLKSNYLSKYDGAKYKFIKMSENLISTLSMDVRSTEILSDFIKDKEYCQCLYMTYGKSLSPEFLQKIILQSIGNPIFFKKLMDYIVEDIEDYSTSDWDIIKSAIIVARNAYNTYYVEDGTGELDEVMSDTLYEIMDIINDIESDDDESYSDADDEDEEE